MLLQANVLPGPQEAEAILLVTWSHADLVPSAMAELGLLQGTAWSVGVHTEEKQALGLLSLS